MNNTPSLDLKIKNLPLDAGVYLMKNEVGEILYIGKAKNLKARVLTYFREDAQRSPRIALLVRKITDFDVVLTDSEVEALILECNLIKKHKPRYNVRLKDDKAYPYVRMNVQHPFPRLEYVRKVRKDGARYFGPYVSSFQVREVLSWARKAFLLRDCSDFEFRNRARPCILHQMGECSAPCVGLVSHEDYHKQVNRVLKLLDGKTDEIYQELEAKMLECSEREEFERAAFFRDQITRLKTIIQDQKITDPESITSRDWVQFARQGEYAIVVVFHVREGKTVGVETFPFDQLDPALPNTEFLMQFLSQYYLQREETQQAEEVLIATQVYEDTSDKTAISTFKEQLLILKRALQKTMQQRKSFFQLRVIVRGEYPEMVAMLSRTADFHLQQWLLKAQNQVEDLRDVQNKLSLPHYPQRIECYDISHFQGEGTVASRVVFLNGKAEKKLYRHYHIRTVEQPDDFKSMQEVLRRRFDLDKVNDGSEQHALPQLVIIDGGKGQLAQAELVLNELGLSQLPVVALAKARTISDFQSQDVKASLERVFKINQKNPILLKPATGAYRILTQLRDESHRFALKLHRKTRDRQRIGH